MAGFRTYITNHKGLISSIIIAISILTAGIYRLERSDADYVTEIKDDSGVVITRGSLAARDTDKDGLPDWEELLYASNPNNPDTDGDGANDGEEVRDGRNPTVPGPNDRLSMVAGPKFATSSTDEEGALRDFYAQYLQSAGEDIKEATFRDLIQKFNPKEFKPRYQLAHLKIISDNSTEAIKTYANAFGSIITRYQKHKFRPELETIQEGLTKKNQNILKGLQIPAVDYKNFALDLTKLAVPSGLGEYHLMIVNSYDLMGRSLLAIIFFLDDPVRGTGAYESYFTHNIELNKGYAGVVHYIHSKNVEFSPEDAGYYFRWRDRWGVATATGTPDTAVIPT